MSVGVPGPAARWWLRVSAWLAVVLAVGTAAAAPPPQVIGSIGSGADGSFVARPTLASFGATGDVLLYSEQDCQIVRCTHDLEIVSRFGTCGRGPGDLSDVLAIAERDSGEIVVLMPSRFETFDATGQRTGGCSWGAFRLSAGVILGDALVGASRAGGTGFAVCRPHRADCQWMFIETPVPSGLDEPESVTSIGSIGASAAFIGDVSGSLYLVDIRSNTVEVSSLGVPRAEVEVSHGAQSTSRNWRRPVMAAWIEDRDFIHMVVSLDNPIPSEDEVREFREKGTLPVMSVRRLDRQSGEFSTYEFPYPEFVLGAAVVSEEGRLLVLDPWGSRVWLLDTIPGRGGDP